MSKGFSSILWDEVVLSPVQIEHLVNGYLGWMGGTVLESADTIMRATGLAPSIPTRRVQDYLLIGRFARTGPTRGTRYMTEFYDNMRDANRVYSDIRFAVQLGDAEKAKKLAEKNKDTLRMRSAYNRAQRAISSINKQMLMIKIKKMSSSKKQDGIELLNNRKNEIAKRLAEKAAE